MPQQFRLLLWKDFLIRKRKLITLAGVLWATIVVSSLFIVRVNIDNVDYPTCYFPARALPSAGMIPFLQSLICGVNNDCLPPDQYEEIPTYENSTLTQMQRKFVPILYNETVMEVAATVPDALKLLATLSEVADEPTFIQFTKKGLRVSDLFKNPGRVENYLASYLDLPNDVAESLMTSQLNLEGIMKSRSKTRTCSSMIEGLLTMPNQEHMRVLTERMCGLSGEKLQGLMGVILEIDFSKFIRMAGNMFYKLKGDDRVIELADTVTAMLRMVKLESFIPAELAGILGKKSDFSYFDVAMITKFMDLFKPTFADTETYKNIKEISDAMVAGAQYLDKVLSKRNTNNTVEDTVNFVSSVVESKGFNNVSTALTNVSAIFKERNKDAPLDVFKILSPVTNFIYKWLPNDTKHDVLLYSTLLAKLVECANRVLDINMSIEERAYNASLRHPKALKTLEGLSELTIDKGFKALADANRIMMITQRIDDPGRIFCDDNQLQTFFNVSAADAADLKNKLCNDDWKNYMSDLIKGFGVYEVKDRINDMASILIQETLGKDTSSRLYTIDKDFEILKVFVESLSTMKSPPKFDWMTLFNVRNDSRFTMAVRRNSFMAKRILITIHGALAREVIKQNTILSFKLTSPLLDTMTLVTAINRQLAKTPSSLTDRVKKAYPDILKVIFSTALKEEKTYAALSTPGLNMLCNGVEHASSYIELPQDTNKEELVETLCDITRAIESGFEIDSDFGQGIDAVRNSKHTPFDNVPWPALVTAVKNLYVKLDQDYPYLFEYSTFGMNNETRENMTVMIEEGMKYWFGNDTWTRSMHLSIKLVLRILDLLDRDIFDMRSETWLKVKYTLSGVSGPIEVMDDLIWSIKAAHFHEDTLSKLPSNTVGAITHIIPHLPQLVYETLEIVQNDTTHVTEVISLINEENWPCSTTSLGQVLRLGPGPAAAVRHIEGLMCMSNDERNQWKAYLDAKGVGGFNLKNWNQTYPPHVFLRFSSALDSLINDSTLLVNLARSVDTDDVTGVLGSHYDVSGIVGTNYRELRESWRKVGDKIKEIMNSSERDAIFRNFFRKLDAVINAVNTTHSPTNLSLNALWAVYNNCSGSPNIDESCRMLGRDVWKYSLEFFSVMCENVARDLLKYFREINEPHASVLQIAGFTRGTPLFEMYAALPNYIAVLVNSYWDHKFMSQVHRASQINFWDCEAVVDAMRPAPGSPVTGQALQAIKPYVCPSVLYWLSLPRGDNTLLDVIAKPQYFLYTLHVENFTSSYENGYNSITELNYYLADLANEKKIKVTENEISFNSIEGLMKNLVDNITDYKISKNDEFYKTFSDTNEKQFAATLYLARVVSMINKIAIRVENLNLTPELRFIQNMFKRKPNEAISLHFDLITEMVFSGRYSLVEMFNSTCNNLTMKRFIIDSSDRLRKQICSKNYEVIYRNIDSGFEEDYDNASKSLLNLVNILQNGASDNITDIFEFLNRRTELVNYMSNSVEYSYELGIPVYLKYLMNQLHHYDVILTFLSGGDWWKELRSLYHGPYAAKFFDSVEKSFEIVMDLFNNLDEIHLVRFLRDINLNDSDIFCNASISVSDYFPDKTGLFSDMKQRMCAEDKGSIYAEILSLTFAAQGYNADLKLSKTINDTALNIIISSTESKLQKLLEKGPQDPQRPPWVTDEEINDFKQAVVGLISKETLTKIMFGLVSNVADAGTLFLNDSQCAVCSHLTSWFKLLNLQVVKKQEYDTLLCHMDAMTLEDVHHVLKNDFHWHMAIQELISTRNYTHLELNKAVQEFLEVVKLHLLEDLNSQSTKISGCLARNVSKNALGNATLFITVLAHTARLLRSELPHLQEVDGIKDVPYLKQMEAAIAHRLVVAVPLKKILLDMKLEDKDIIGGEILNSGVRFGSITDLDQPLSVILPNIDWGTVCKERDCKKLANTLNRNINRTVLENELLTLKSEQFWSFNFLSNILYHIEALLGHSTGLLGVASKVDLAGVMRGRLEALVDFMVQLMVEDTMNEVLYSIQGLSKELHPLLEGASLEYDLGALGRGLAIVQQFKDYLLENEYLKIKVSEFYPDREAIEQPLHRLGINNTNFWSLAAPRIYIGHIDLTPIFSQKQGDFHISNYVCSIEEMSNVIAPGDLDVVTGDDVFGAVAEQFCGLTDRQAKEMLPALVQGLDLTAVFDKLKSMILPQLYEASNLTRSEGDLVMERYPRMVALLPTIQGSVGELTESLAREPLVKELSGFNSVGGLLGSSDIISNVGRMVCGKRLEMKENRLYNAITSSKDFSTDFNQAEIDRLPTEFCREMYRDILRMQGGKIVWSFIKPMIMGKILYTPSNPVTEMIMQKANSSFATMIRLTTMVHSFAGSLPALDKVSSHREGVAALRAAMASLGPGLGAEVPTGNVSGLFEDIGDFKDIGSVLKKGSDLLRCFDLNRFRTVPDEFELTHQAVKLTLVNEFSAGIVFLNTEGKEDLPKNIEYKIRMDVDNVPTTARLRNYLWVPGPEASFLEDMRYFRGFVHIQDMLDTAIIQLSRSSSRREKRETRTEDESKWAVYTQQEPYPCYRKDFFQTSLYESQALLVAFFFSLLFTVSSVVRFNVQEKETGNTMLMSVMGVNLSYHTLSWFVASSLEVAATCCCMCAVLALGGVLPQTSGTLLLALLLIMGFSTLSFCYMLSKFFTSASFGAVCSAIAYLVTFMPVVLILSLEAVLTNILKLFVCLSMSSAICYSFLYVARFEAMGKGAQWEDIFTGIDGEDMSIAAGAIMALVDAVIYFAIGYLVDRYTGVRAVQSNITTYTATDEKAGVSIINVSKTYRGRWRGQDRLALDNVSIELHKGQITALLGHNGAGKTTLINILTGMLKPTKGDVIVRSEAGATRVGVCAQRDVLHAQLTAYEHVVLYAQLKSGKRLDELQDEVDSILRALSLGAVAHEPVAQLSGGTRRRLCVALAFVARPQLVSLDEPTSGVDPAARSILRVLSLGAVAHEPVAQLSGGTRRRLCVALAFVARPQLVSLDEPTSGVDPAARSIPRALSLGAVAHEPVAQLSGGTRRRLYVALAFVARPQLVSLDEPTSGVDPAARSILRVLSLGAVAHEPVAQLSGGTRRRLCVALAFVARPQLVSLDEPTSGVDPAARRDIWSMIVKLREDRTILMTTHHLDEAELLSDQIVIMHKGQIHTTGSPIEIKRSLGNGYKLTVSYPPSTEDSEEVSIEERSKQLMSVVRNSVKNASLVDASGLDVEIGLPFFDGNGLNNNFLHLCTSVEASQQALGYRGYSLDCSSLEQVFFNICHQADGQPNQAYEFDPDMPSHSTHSTSSASVRSNTAPLVPMQGPLKGSSWHQFTALLHARYLHYIRNRWLLFLLLVLPALFVGLAMAFSLVRPPADNEIPLTLNPALYRNSTQYLIPKPSDSSKIMDTSFAESVMERLRHNKKYRNWTSEDTPDCKCGERRQECDLTEGITRYRPEMMLLPNASTLNEWIVASHDAYIEKRYGGYSSSVKNNVTNFIVWYNNKGHHALPAFLSAMSSAILGGDVTITAHAHTLKISREQLTKDTVYQHVADAGISALVLIAYSLVSAGGAIYLVSARRSQEKRLQLLCGVSPAVYWGAALASDMIIILINLVITVILFESFGFPVFVARNNLLAICLLIVLFGYACASLVHVAEKLFSEASMANMVLFTGNAFLGLAGITLLLILDIISESDTTDNARWALHKVFLLSPQFALGDGLLEIAKNTIQAQVLDRFGMDTYKDPLSTPLVAYHYIALVLVGTALLALNLAIEYDCFHDLWLCIRPQPAEEIEPSEMEDVEVAAERKRVVTSLARDKPLRISTIGNINAGYVDTEEMKERPRTQVMPSAGGDACHCVGLSKVYPSLSGPKVAVKSLTLGIPTGQCTALLGQNGAGKSTTFAMLTGQERPTAGRIYLNDCQVGSRQLCSGLISYCPQSDAIDPLLTVRETLQMYCRLRGITDQEQVIKRTIEMFDLTKYAGARNGTLSGGNKRKLCTAIAFMGRTPLVLLDEPTSGMDPGSRGCVARGATCACAARRAVLLSTHALRDARRLAGRVALLRAGTLAALASVDDCLTRFGGGYVVSCRVRGGAARAVWRRVLQRAPHATLQVLHHATINFLVPVHATVDGKEITTSLSDIFRLMAELQTTCDIEDFTVNQSSLDQMFLSFSDKTEEDLDMSEYESAPQTPSCDTLNTPL